MPNNLKPLFSLFVDKERGMIPMDFMINFVIIALFIFPFIALIHELGHAFFLKLFGGTIREFAIGIGDVLWQKNKFSIRTVYFAGGWVLPKDISILTKTQKSFYYLGGVIFNLLSALALDLFTGYEFLVFRNYLDSFIFVSYLNVLVNLIPLTYISGTSDGEKIVKLYKRI